VSDIKIGVILGSIREIRRGGRVAKWLMPQLEKLGGAGYELLDLRDYPLPFFNESNSPEGLERNYTNEVAQRWSAKINAMDGFIIITSEYNHGIPGVLKNALDWLYSEWNKKPVGFVSYAPGAVGGVRGVEQLRQNVIELQMAPMREAVHIAHVLDVLDEEGNILKGHASEKLAVSVKELLWWTKALKKARSEDNGG
jgi:NAD(P)H-dependent FMN reductase